MSSSNNNLIYLLWKPAIIKSTFNSRIYFIKLFKGRKVLSFAKAQLSQRHQMYKIVFLSFFFHFGVEKTSNSKREKVQL